MCGIAGVMAPQDILRDSGILAGMAKNLGHRGPDDEGMVRIRLRDQPGRTLGLVHRRLSIIDLSETGHQPMQDHDSGNWIVFNGEIYNYRSIKQDLEERGINFVSASDTEVILKAYRYWGTDCLQRLRGMFAFGLWDERKQELLLAQDRFGIKPLYLYCDPQQTVIFASEIRAILETGLVARKIDPTALDGYLAYGAVQAPHTMIAGIRSLLPGHYLIIKSDGSIRDSRRYWNIPFRERQVGGSLDPSHQMDILAHELRDSMRHHLVSDVPVGVFLSGGVDSSSMVALVQEVTGRRPMTFSVTFREQEYNEGTFSQTIAEEYNTQHQEIRLHASDLLEFLPAALAAMDQPTIDGINVYTISRVVHKAGLKTVLSGQGGDELFAGYNTFRNIPSYLRWAPVLNILPLNVRRYLAQRGSYLLKRKGIGHKASALLEANGRSLAAYYILRALFLPEAREALMAHERNPRLNYGLPPEVANDLSGLASRLDPVNQVSLFELKIYLANMLLRDGDFMSMAHGLEVRVPFLDHRLVEFMADVPVQMKMVPKVPKPLLLKSLARPLPRAIYQRPKTGFTFPWEYWLRNQLSMQIKQVIEQDDIGNAIGLNAECCRFILKQFLAGVPGYTWSRVWGIYVLYQWCQRHRVTL